MTGMVVDTGKAILTSRLAGGGTEPKQMGWGTSAGSTATTDTTLFGEKGANLVATSGSRTAGVSSQVTTWFSNDTYQMAATLTATGAGTVTNAGAFDNSTIGSGNLFFKADFTGIPLSIGDSITFTVKVQFAGAPPALALDFTTGVLDGRITFTRASSGTYVNSSGVIASASTNVARFDHDKDGNPLGLQVEEARTNLTYPSNLVGFGANNGTNTDSGVLSRDGTNNFRRLTSTGGGTEAILYNGTTITTAATTWSVDVKYQNNQWVTIKMQDGVGAYHAFFDLVNGIIGTRESGVTDSTIKYVGNSTYRITATCTPAGTGGYFVVGLADADNNPSSASAGKYADFACAQIETGSFATSPIPTTSGTVTRAADNASMTGSNFSSWYNQTAGTFVVAADRTNGSAHILNANDGSSSNRMLIYSNDLTLYNVNGGVNDVALDIGVFSTTTVSKAAYTYALNDFAGCVGAGVVATDTSGSPPTVDRLCLGMTDGLSAQISGHIKSLTYYASRLDNLVLQALTT